MSWWVIAALAVGTFAFRAAGPTLLARVALPAWAQRVVDLLPPALLAAVVTTQLRFDLPLLAGVAIAVAILWRRGSLLMAVGAAMAVAAVARWLGG